LAEQDKTTYPDLNVFLPATRSYSAADRTAASRVPSLGGR